MQQKEIWLVILFLSNKKFHAKLICVLSSSMKLGPGLDFITPVSIQPVSIKPVSIKPVSIKLAKAQQKCFLPVYQPKFHKVYNVATGAPLIFFLW